MSGGSMVPTWLPTSSAPPRRGTFSRPSTCSRRPRMVATSRRMTPRRNPYIRVRPAPGRGPPHGTDGQRVVDHGRHVHCGGVDDMRAIRRQQRRRGTVDVCCGRGRRPRRAARLSSACGAARTQLGESTLLGGPTAAPAGRTSPPRRGRRRCRSRARRPPRRRQQALAAVQGQRRALRACSRSPPAAGRIAGRAASRRPRPRRPPRVSPLERGSVSISINRLPRPASASAAVSRGLSTPARTAATMMPR